jgi:hypothetical protein
MEHLEIITSIPEKSYLRFHIPVFISALFLVTFIMQDGAGAQQRGDDLSFSVGIAGGVAPQFTLGELEDSGIAIKLFAELQYRQVLGQLSYTSIMGETIGDGINSLDKAYAVHGSLGYVLLASDRLHIPLMATLGGMFIDYTSINSFGSPGNSFFDANWQLGITIAPRYSITDKVSAYGALRYMQGMVTHDGSESINLVNAALGLRFTLM